MYVGNLHAHDVMVDPEEPLGSAGVSTQNMFDQDQTCTHWVEGSNLATKKTKMYEEVSGCGSVG